MPWTMGAFGIGALTMIGIPPTVGFIGKWFMLRGATETSQWFVVGVIGRAPCSTPAIFFPSCTRFSSARKPHDGHMIRRSALAIVLAPDATAIGTLALFWLPDVPLALANRCGEMTLTDLIRSLVGAPATIRPLWVVFMAAWSPMLAVVVTTTPFSPREHSGSPPGSASELHRAVVRQLRSRSEAAGSYYDELVCSCPRSGLIVGGLLCRFCAGSLHAIMALPLVTLASFGMFRTDGAEGTVPRLRPDPCERRCALAAFRDGFRPHGLCRRNYSRSIRPARIELAAALAYAGSAIGVVFAGDLVPCSSLGADGHRFDPRCLVRWTEAPGAGMRYATSICSAASC